MRDAVVVGAPDDRWGERVVAVVAPVAGTEPTLAELQAFCHTELAGYKVPKDLVIVEHVRRAPSGKPDYQWAKSLIGGTTGSSHTPESSAILAP